MPASDRGNASIELACGLTEEIVRKFGEVRLRVFGTSMVPSVLPGDFVSVRRTALQDISSGDVVLFFRGGRLFLHRVVQRTAVVAGASFPEPTLITCGDRLRHNDSPVFSSELLGRVVSVERDDRNFMVAAAAPNPLVRVLQCSDGVTYLYLRLLKCWRALFSRRTKCPV